MCVRACARVCVDIHQSRGRENCPPVENQIVRGRDSRKGEDDDERVDGWQRSFEPFVCFNRLTHDERSKRRQVLLALPLSRVEGQLRLCR